MAAGFADSVARRRQLTEQMRNKFDYEFIKTRIFLSLAEISSSNRGDDGRRSLIETDKANCFN